MGIVFAVRGDSIAARYSTSGKTPNQYVTPGQSAINVVTGAGTGIIGDAYINQSGRANNEQGLLYPGQNNLPVGPAFSVLLRAQRKSNINMALFAFKSALDLNRNSFRVYRNTGGNIGAIASRENGGEVLTNSPFGVDMTLNTWEDYVITCTGVTGANGFKFYKDGTLLYQTALTFGFNLPLSQIAVIPTIGYSADERTSMWTNEFVIWDEVIDPTNVLLTSGLGSLNGVSRTAFVDVAAFDGTVSSDPGVVNVKSAINYMISGSSYVGTLSSTDPGIANVRLGSTYSIESVSKTGTLVVPGAANVKLGVVFDANTVGTLESTDPGELNVKQGTTYIIESVNKSGSLVSTNPGSSNVVVGAPYIVNNSSFVGVMTLPSASQVLLGVGYGLSQTGTLQSTDPGELNVKQGTTYIIESVNKSGSLVSTNPGSSSVLLGVGYVVNNVSFTGAYVTPPASTNPGESNVKNGVTYLYQGVSQTGALVSTNPGAGNVKKGVEYTIENVDYEGSFISGLNANSGNFSPVPQMSGAMLSYFQNMVFTVVEKSTTAFQAVEVGTEVNFRGVFQPAGARVLHMKPEGQRMWKWFIVHSNIQLPLEPDDVITYLGTQYRIKSDKNYELYGYYEYEIIEDYTGSGPET